MRVFVESNHYDQMRRWMREMDELDEKERTMDV